MQPPASVQSGGAPGAPSAGVNVENGAEGGMSAGTANLCRRGVWGSNREVLQVSGQEQRALLTGIPACHVMCFDYDEVFHAWRKSCKGFCSFLAACDMLRHHFMGNIVPETRDGMETTLLVDGGALVFVASPLRVRFLLQVVFMKRLYLVQ